MKLLITAGPTREFIDPVRFISNRSSGKMGYELAIAARQRGHDVVLVSGPVALPCPVGVHRVPVVAADDMLAAVRKHLPACEVLIMAAAVADFRPAVRLAQKWKKTVREPTTLALEPTPDILLTIRSDKGDRLFVGFAAETERVVESARGKCAAKGMDLIVANDVTRADAGFDVDTNVVTLVDAAGVETAWPLMTKAEVAERLIRWVEEKGREQGAGGREQGAGAVASDSSSVAAGADRGEGGASDGTGDRNAGLANRTAPNVRGYSSGGRVETPPPDVTERLGRQMAFLREIDKLKSVYRRTLLMDGSRFENDAEHSWHLAVMAMLLVEHANTTGLDIGKVVRMVLAHDLVEIDAGDTYVYDTAGNVGKLEREARAADRIFGLLPGDQAAEFRALWDEFETRETPEARFAAALDRVQPLLHNFATQGTVWRQHGITSGRVADRNRHVADGSRALWTYAEGLIREAVARGYLDP